MRFHNSRGLTLVEVLAVLVLLSLVTLLILSVLSFGQKNYSTQQGQVQKQQDLTYITKLIAKEVRQAKSVKIENGLLVIDTNTYTFKENSIYKNNSELISGIQTFNYSLNGIKLTFTITGNDDARGNANTVSTNIYIRK
jgi:Na+-transporting NADH:ubiquinone oxidoreductase subunit NqrC